MGALAQGKPQIFDTVKPNVKGICALSHDVGNLAIAYPSAIKGNAHIEVFQTVNNNLEVVRKALIMAHESDIACLALSKDGKLLATASDKGTLIRVFDIGDNPAKMIKEVRRGSSKAEIYCISFSNDKNYLCTTSSSGTVHIFNIDPNTYVCVKNTLVLRYSNVNHCDNKDNMPIVHHHGPF